MESEALFIIGVASLTCHKTFEATNYMAGLNAVQVTCVGGSTVFLPYGAYEVIEIQPTQRLRDMEEAELQKVLAEQRKGQEGGIEG